MEQIRPAYATFEQAKKLKEKRFNEICFSWYSDVGDRILYGAAEMDFKAPEQWQVVEWLRVNHGIHLEVSCDVYGELWFVKLEVCSKEVWDDLDKRHKILTAHRKFNNEHKSKQEAYSAAFDYILNNLI
jgi:hypothetical protein